MTSEAMKSRRTMLRWLTVCAGGLSAMSLRAATPLRDAESAEPAMLEGGAMLQRIIASSGEAIPVIGLGTWQSFDVDASSADRAPLVDVMREFVRLGGKVIDSSPMYGNSELVAGDILAQLRLRDRLFIATKVWTSGREAGIAQMRDSMEKLRAKPIDLMQVHNLLDVRTHLDTLAGWKREGLVRHIGVTHYTASSHDDVAKVLASYPIDAVQINYSVMERDAEKRLLPLAREKGVAVIVNRPFAGGGLFARLRAKPVPAWATEIDCRSWAQLLLKFVVAHPAVTCAIPATSKVTHLRDNMAAGQGRMPDQDMRRRIAQTALE